MRCDSLYENVKPLFIGGKNDGGRHGTRENMTPENKQIKANRLLWLVYRLHCIRNASATVLFEAVKTRCVRFLDVVDHRLYKKYIVVVLK